MANSHNALSGTIKTAVATLLVSGTVFYALGTMGDGDADLHVSSETYRYESEGIRISTSAPETDVPVNDDSLTPLPETESASFDEGLMTEAPPDIDTSGSADVPISADTLSNAVTDFVMDTEPVGDNTSHTVYWVANGEVWHVSEKCPSLSRSKKILSGSVEDALLNGKARVCKRCGN